MVYTARKNTIKTDTVLKNFWRDNARFADLFNAVLFNGEQKIEADALEEADTDISGILKFSGHAETLQKILDVVKKSAYGVEFVILGLENQQHIHYAMPLRIMVGDALGYLKEYESIVRKNKEEGKWKSTEEFLSGFHREDRLHPIVTICVYYGEKNWDGPSTLTDMLKLPEDLQMLVNDYKMNVIQVRESESLRFQNRDVQTVFDVSRSLLKGNYQRITDVYREQELDSELGLVIGAITESRELMNHALERKGGKMNMCSALEQLKREGVEEGIKEGIKEGIEQGELNKAREIAFSLVEMGLTVDQIAHAVKINVETVEKWMKEGQ